MKDKGKTQQNSHVQINEVQKAGTEISVPDRITVLCKPHAADLQGRNETSMWGPLENSLMYRLRPKT
jgi:hypothetical protein